MENANPSNASTPEKDLQALNETEDKLILLMDIVREVTRQMGDQESTTEESIQQTAELTRKYMQTVDV